ncbi:MAG: S8 family serine peptidase [Bacteroidales bacterium]|nr:S8 family serine peptidase [Lentimicrobiaceae bacterium]MDD5695716.1 S8 family serine peptidase [Bacteroidales bacterium]
MKTFIKILFALAALTALGWTFRENNPFQGTMQKKDADKTALAPATDRSYHEGIITVKLKPGTGDFGKQNGAVHFGISTLDEKIAAFQAYQLEKRFRYNPAKLRSGLPDLSRIYKLSFPESFSVIEVAEAFASDPNVEYAEPIPVMYLAVEPNDAMYSQLEHLPQIFAPQAWEIHKGENGDQDVVIAIVDTGVDWDHVDLQSNVWQNLAEDADGDGHTMEYDGTKWVLDPGDLNNVDDEGDGFTDDLLGWNFITNSGDPNPIPSNPLAGHGTHCAGISNGATNNGTGIASISWNLKVMGICVDANNSIPYGWDGIIYAAENGADIISNSYGGPTYSQAGQDVVTYATGLGSIVLGCAHNWDNTELIYPASFRGVISVAAVEVDDTKTDYSNFNLLVDVSAPGGGYLGGILSTVPGNMYEALQGTSMATPMVAGCFGLLKSYHPDWTNDQLITRLLGTADNIDSLNPNYVNMLGTGRINAYRMLAEENVKPMLKLELSSVTAADENGNGINEQGETVTLNFSLRNYAAGLDAEDVVISILTQDPEITIINGSYTMYLPSDTTFNINNQFKIQVSPTVSSHIAEMTLHLDTDATILMGQDIPFQVLVAPSGIFVFEGEPGGQDYSGSFIAGFLNHLGYGYTYANTLPSLMGFETVFLSYGNGGESMDMGIPFTENTSISIQQYLQSGGKLYIEKGGLFRKMSMDDFSNKVIMRQLFGVNMFIGSSVENPIDSLMGVEDTPAEGILFTQSDQVYNWHIDKLIPAATANTPFYENDYGNVALMNDGSATYGHKTFYSGYSLAGLRDRNAISSRYNVLLKTMEFFGYSLPQGYILSNFLAENTQGSLPLEVHFTDISISDPNYPTLSWKWDFNDDGTIDSYEKDPVWICNEGGEYDVKLITSNGIRSDTLILEKLITANAGYLVWEGVENGDDYSGTFIRNYLQENAYTLTYRNEFPKSLEGFSAVFLSFGNSGSGKTSMDEQMASVLTEYLEGGGYVYLEGGDALGHDQASNSQLINLCGLAAASDGGESNPINSLEGKPAAITNGMVFTGSSQTSSASIDKFAPSSNGVAAFYESAYGTVAVQQSIPDGRRTFCFSYSLADLNDGVYPNTREELLQRILNFFDIYTALPEIADNTIAGCRVYPNPVFSISEIKYQIAKSKSVELKVYDCRGSEVYMLVNQEQAPGEYIVPFDVTDLPVGIYLVRLQAGEDISIVKVAVMK